LSDLSFDSLSGHFSGRVVVVSPHLDDAIFSLGAAIAHAVRTGARIEVLTVFAGDPQSDARAGDWDARSGFSTEGQAATSRREEDREACAFLGAKPQWLTFGDEQYDRHGGEQEVWSAVASATASADSVLVPGFPLTNADHAWLSELLIRRGLACRRIALYAEQPYAFEARKAQREPSVAAPLKPLTDATVAWSRLRTSSVDRWAKHQAMRAYRSQLRLCGLARSGLYRMLWNEGRRGGEAVAWLPETS